jgi:hypothetical protein
MTIQERREIYWEMYTVAVGLDMLMTSDEMRGYNYLRPYPDFPRGMCKLCKKLFYDYYMLDYLPELKEPVHRNMFGGWWWKEYDWNIRSKELIKAIKRTYK